MSFESVLLLTAVWLLLGFLVFRRASSVSAREEASRLDALEQELEEVTRERAKLAKELEAVRADQRRHGNDIAAPV